MEISRDQAICMFFYVEYTEENAKKYRKWIEDFGAVEICYNIKPTQPILVSLERIYENPQSYHLYPANTSNPKT
jgi:hypothetical protein